jgi:hypothetical protein
LSDNSKHSSLGAFRVPSGSARFAAVRFAVSRGPRVLVQYTAVNIRFFELEVFFSGLQTRVTSDKNVFVAFF